MTEIVFRYTGKDPMEAHFSGIPARDLTQEDYDALDTDARALVRKSALYEKVDAPRDEPKKEEPKKADEKKS